MKRILIATGNPGKFDEIVSILGNLEIELMSLNDLDIEYDMPDETENTYEGNSLLKAKHFYKLTGIPTIAEDSGIHVEALADELGVKTRRWGAGHDATDEEWISYFLDKMSVFENRMASFVSAASIVTDDIEEVFLGRTSGAITQDLRAPIKRGLPLSSCFLPDGSDKVYAAMNEEEKTKVSHRGESVTKLSSFLKDISNG